MRYGSLGIKDVRGGDVKILDYSVMLSYLEFEIEK